MRELAGVAETANVLMLRLALRDRAAVHQFPGRIFRNYMALGGQSRWRSQSIFDFLPELRTNRLRITLEHIPSTTISTPVDELAYLALITSAIQPRCIFEIGTFTGRTALAFAMNSPSDCRIFTLDLPQDADIPTLGAADQMIAAARLAGADYAGRPEAQKITQLWGNSRSFEFRPYYGAVDLVFVDGGHTYEIARSDTENALKMVRPGGVIVWHDWGNYGEYHDVTRAVLDLLPSDRVIQLDSSQLAVYRAG